MEGADGGQDMGGIGPLGATGLDPAAGFAGGEEGIQQALGRLMGEQPLAKIV